jgi:hypothetical protein
MKNFKAKEIRNFVSKNAKVQYKTIRVSSTTDKKPIHWEQAKQYYDLLIKSGLNANKIGVVVKALDSNKTLKSFNDANLKNWDDDEYYADKAKDIDKFNSYFYVDFTIKK